VRVEGDTVIGFAVDSEVIELVGAALQQGGVGVHSDQMTTSQTFLSRLQSIW
jgi:hypothetical protein